MREIKFRAWDYKNDKMRPWEDVSISWAMCILGQSDKQAWMQFTGLHDKNGKEIYEGDLVGIQRHDYEIAAILWDRDGACWLAGVLSLGGANTFFDGKPEKDVSDIEVIGNIYENPHLLNQ